RGRSLSRLMPPNGSLPTRPQTPLKNPSKSGGLLGANRHPFVQINRGYHGPRTGDCMTTDTFDWGSIPYETWKEFAALAGSEERHAKFAAAKFRGCTNTQAAREAGYGAGGGTSTRSEGYRVARSNKVNQILALAAAEAGGGYDGTLTKQES